MSLVSPLQLPRDVFARGPHGTHPNWLHVLLPLPALGAVGAVVLLRPSAFPVAAMLTATSILTGLTFTMALRFWEKSIDARRDPNIASDGARLDLLDRMRAHLVWTVLIGVISTFVLALVAIFASPADVPVPIFASATFLVVYQISLVGGALIEFYRASYDLR